MTFDKTFGKRLMGNRGIAASVGLAAGILFTTQAKAEPTAETVLCDVLSEVRSIMLSGGWRIPLGDANNAMKAIDGLIVPSLKINTCEESGIHLGEYAAGSSHSYSFEFDELGNPEIWCGFSVDNDTSTIRYPYCRGK